MPLLRWRTKDRVRFDLTPCPCGRAYLRLAGGILGRSDDRFPFAGVDTFHYRITVTPDVELAKPGELPRFEHKARRLVRQV